MFAKAWHAVLRFISRIERYQTTGPVVPSAVPSVRTPFSVNSGPISRHSFGSL